MTKTAPTRREMSAEECALDYVENLHLERHTENLHSGRPKDYLLDAIADEVSRLLCLANKTERRDAIEDTTLSDLIDKAARKYAAREREDGDLNEEVEEVLREDEGL